MKKLFFLLVVISLLFLQVSAYAIAPQGCKSYRLTAGTAGDTRAHAHATTRPARIYAITVTATVNGGFAQILDTASLPYTKPYVVTQDPHYLTYPTKAGVGNYNTFFGDVTPTNKLEINLFKFDIKIPNFLEFFKKIRGK